MVRATLVITIETSSSAPYVYIQSIKERAIHKVYLGQESGLDKVFLLPHLCSRLAAAYVSGDQEVVIGLTPSMRLYINDKIFSNECTSFSLA